MTIICPFNRNLKIVLDKGQIFPDDPGMGTPAMVYRGKDTATFWCASDTGEVDMIPIPENEWDWLVSQYDTVNEYLYK